MARWSWSYWVLCAIAVSCGDSGAGSSTGAQGGAAGDGDGTHTGGIENGAGAAAGGGAAGTGEPTGGNGGDPSQPGGAGSGDGAAGGSGGSAVDPGGSLAGSSNAGAGGEGGSLPDQADEMIDVVRNGGSVDINGDGKVDLTTRLDGDARVISIPDELHPLLIVTRHANGTADKRGDFNLDGKTDFIEAETETASSLLRTTESDRDFDGHFEERELLELDLVAGTYHLVSDSRGAGEVTWVNVEDRTGTATAPAGAGNCTGMEGYPAAGFTTDTTVVGTLSIAGVDPRTPLVGACSKTQTARIETALLSLFRNTLDELAPLEDFQDAGAIQCLSRRQPAFLEALVHTVSNGHGARIACGGSCAGTIGATDTGTPRINLNFSEIGPSSQALQGVLLHELIHSAGYPFGPEQRDDHNNTNRDSIYACERWCTGSSLSPDGVVDTQDCFRCSGTLAAKQECCGDLTVCVGGCCDGPCASDGTCGDPCSVAKSNGLSCGYEGTTTTDATVNGFGWIYTGQIRLQATELVTNFQAGGSQLVKRGIRYKPTGTINAALPGVEDLGCAPVPTQVPLTDTSFTGDFILGIDPPGVFASGTVNVPGGTAIVCKEGGAPPQGNAWGWLLIIPVGPLTRPNLTGNVPIPGGSPSTCSWNLKAVDPSTW